MSTLKQNCYFLKQCFKCNFFSVSSNFPSNPKLNGKNILLFNLCKLECRKIRQIYLICENVLK